ncbi:hypothetical protein P7K49_037079 [Saguinus oedipus]|uniref:Uncharacterized protein n=1 Tax=Saguinus oedipus TaxID=9490 RepID=A0ABQ9TM49_SAGOE|nr:hypothetical protein P7K49_037079 [Saguinus oedipus]
MRTGTRGADDADGDARGGRCGRGRAGRTMRTGTRGAGPAGRAAFCGGASGLAARDDISRCGGRGRSYKNTRPRSPTLSSQPGPPAPVRSRPPDAPSMREIVHIQAGQCGNQIGAKVRLRAPACPGPQGGRREAPCPAARNSSHPRPCEPATKGCPPLRAGRPGRGAPALGLWPSNSPPLPR